MGSKDVSTLNGLIMILSAENIIETEHDEDGYSLKMVTLNKCHPGY